MKLKLFFVIILVCFRGIIYSQSLISTVQSNDVYSFLSELQTKGIIQQRDYVDLQTDKEVLNLLNIIEANEDKLSSIEKERLQYFKLKYWGFDKDYSLLNGNILNGVSNWLKNKPETVFSYKDSTFTLKLKPVVRIGVKSVYNETQTFYGWGADLRGSIGNNVGFRIDFMDNTLKAKNYERKLSYEPTTGRIYTRSANNEYQFSETNGSFVYSNNYLTVGFVKENFKFGQGKNGQLVMSSKTPSFPAIYLKLSPTDWLKFYYMHGWLISGVTDSGKTYDTELMPRKSEKEKYYAMHAIQFIPIPELSITLGETIIYSDRGIYGGYLIPFVFFRSVDHQFTYGSGDSGNNGSFFAEISGNPLSGVNLYSSAFFDEFSLTNLLKGGTDRNQFGYTVGLNYIPNFINDFSFNIEYTKILPWVYSNWIPTQTYRNANYLMGHYIGQNADQIYFETKYYPLYNLELKANISYTRNGGFSSVDNQYKKPGEEFLYGLIRKETKIGFSATYELLFDLYTNLTYQFTNITDEDKSRTPSYMLGTKHAVEFNINYGL